MTPAQANHLLAKHLEANDPDEKNRSSSRQSDKAELTPDVISSLSNLRIQS